MLGLVLSSFAFAYWYFISGWNEAKNTTSSRQIPVTGEGKIAIEPDIAVFTTSVVTQAAKIKDAQTENSKRSNSVVDFLKKQGVEDKDLKTVGYNISPQYQYDSRPCIQIYPSPCPQNPPKIASYEVRNTLEIKVRSLEKVDDFLSGVVDNGANEVSSVHFKIDDEEKVRAEVRRKAIEDARAKAKILARDLGVRLGKIVSYSDVGGYPIFSQALDVYGKGGDLDTTVSSPRIQAGEQEIKVSVTIVYEFR